MDGITILVADDEKEITDAVCKLLERENYITRKAYNGLEALEILNKEEIHLIILDIMMPKQDGLTTTMKIRQEKNIPVIILSAKTEKSDIILGLDIGADDYIAKPYSPDELLARVRSQTRRYMTLGDFGSSQDSVNEIIKNGRLVLNTGEKQLYADGLSIKLTPKEYKIMDYLMHNIGRVFSAEEIYEHIWNETAYSVENTVMVHIRRIREKIEINPGEPKYLKVVWGIGYKIEKHS